MSEKFGPFTFPEEHIIKMTQNSYVFTAIKPVVDGHLLVSPLRCVQFFEDLTEIEKRDFANLAKLSGEIMKKHMHTTALSMTIQNGPIAGQTVSHLHIHIIPRNLPTKWLKVPKFGFEEQKELTMKYRKYFEEEGEL